MKTRVPAQHQSQNETSKLLQGLRLPPSGTGVVLSTVLLPGVGVLTGVVLSTVLLPGVGVLEAIASEGETVGAISALVYC